MLAILAAHTYTQTAPVEIQSFEIANLRYLRAKLGGKGAANSRTNIRLLQLLVMRRSRPTTWWWPAAN